MKRSILYAIGGLGLFALALASAPVSAAAQAAGRIVGTVTEQQGAPVGGAQVSVVGTRLGAITNQSGQFVVTGVPTGSQSLRVTSIGFRPGTAEVVVQSGEAVTVNVRLEGAPVELGGVVVSAARRAQRITDAPATITQIGPDVIDNAVGNTFAGALKQAVGLDFIQTGMTTAAVNARGFNSSFNNRMLMLEDGRVAVLPESGLPIGSFTTTPKIDLAGIEVLVGPGAALYGADASSGVISLTTKDPRQFPGTTVEVTGGNREYRNIQARHAGVFGDWGYKATAEYQSAQEWENQLFYTAALLPETGVGGRVNWQSQVARGQGSLVRYFGDGRLELGTGASRTDGIGQTNVGRNQFDGWTYNFQQARLTTSRWFAQVYRTQSQAGDSYALNRFTENRANPAHRTKSDEEVRRISDWPSDGRLVAAELQHNLYLPALLNTHVVFGAQYRRDMVSSDRKWLTDRLTGEDLVISQRGIYGQAEAPLTPWLNLVLAGRIDDHDNYDTQFSPKAGLVVKPAENQAVRFTYNRAFKSPTLLQTNFHIPDWTAVVAIFGNTEGFQIFNNAQGAGSPVVSYDPLRPEENTTWEVGFKGVFASRLFLDVVGYQSQYENFMSPLVIISNPYAVVNGQPAPTFAFQNGQAVANNKLVLTYFNLGRAKLHGTDAGVNFYVSPRFSLNGSMSWLKLQDVEVPAGREEATSLNSPSTKWTLGTRFQDVGPLQGGATVRHVNSYYFRSGINMGVIPTFSTLDLSLGYRLRPLNTTLTMGVNNLFSCSQKLDENGVGFRYDTAPGVDPLRMRPLNKERECGFNARHQEMINMPAIGTMFFLGGRYHIQ
jgi:outer membrane receptor for ferrienterochelin and colicins